MKKIINLETSRDKIALEKELKEMDIKKLSILFDYVIEAYREALEKELKGIDNKKLSILFEYRKKC